ncbi:hypothetical protein ASPVEDRAFT_42857 [Aspergillus versicolor CBS 583.65]|uniref:Protein kinase domain-containing protein n=1 Tax=Aspergillus versicolor CBS 583.65 TaxID=1036611 RepID=A0A1L9PP78_ASPVE|nr:uncharacterized protein ASPVEDRAFT_42857 [Aspergillus versicolor CBS 583.65]OJJ03347.1 hypothetical protein ASPVEDRAFT_42857 [Aspergillus versicolor CBS 583.65]
MDPASVALAVVSVIDLCYKYGNKLAVLCHQYRHLDADLGEIILSIQASWLKMDIQLKSLRAICDKLDYPLLNLYHDALTHLEAKLTKASESFQVVQAKTGVAFNVHQKLKAVYLKRELAQTVGDLEEWQRRFDPSWYLITRIANPDVDRKLQNVRPAQQQQQQQQSQSPSTRLTRMRESIKQLSSQGEETTGSIFKDATSISSGMLRVEGTNAYLSKYKNGARSVILDPANLLSQSQVSSTTAKLHIRDLARLLLHIDPLTFHLLRCDGVIELPTAYGMQFHLLLEIPAGLSSPKTLRRLLLQRPIRKCSLSQRIQLSKQLARSVMFVHTAGFVHKNISPTTDLVFHDDKGNVELGPSFLIGFERIRKAEGRTEKFGDLDWEKNLYRHPLRQGLHPEDIFEMRHDIYSLGVCLLEIALWESFVRFEDGEGGERKAVPWSGLEILDSLADRDQRRGAFATKDRLLEICKEDLPSVVGEKYTSVVVACLCCLDETDDNPFRDEKSFQDRDGIVIGVRYIENVLLKLEELVI